MALGSSEHDAWLERQLDQSSQVDFNARSLGLVSEDHEQWLDRQIGVGANTFGVYHGGGELAKVTNAYEQKMYEESHGALAEPRLVSTDAALGSVRHTAWVDAQLATRTGSSLRFSNQPSPLRPPQQQQQHQEQEWPQRLPPAPMLAKAPAASASAGLPLPPSPPRLPVSPVRQPDTRLPGGVNALLRGQDLSAQSHEEWLHQQLARAASAALVGGASTEQQRWLMTERLMQQQPTLGRSSGLTPRAARREDEAHSRWLDTQLTPSARKHPESPLRQAVQDCALGSRRHTDWLERQLLAGGSRGGPRLGEQ